MMIGGLDHARSVVRDLSTELSRKKLWKNPEESYLFKKIAKVRALIV